MAFAATQTGQTVMGNMRMVYGTFTNDDTSGEVNTGMKQVHHFTCTGATITGEKSGYPGVMEVTIAAGSTGGFWFALGY
jgi:hypothetical protein